MPLFAIFDSAVKAYMNPFVLRSKGEAIRAFADGANDPKTQVFAHPDDYTLFHLGYFDPENGRIEVLEAFESLGTALEWKDAQERPVRMVADA